MTRSEEERAILYSPMDENELSKGRLYREDFDLELFFEFLATDVETVEDREIFFEKKRREYREWLAKDLVVDTRETWTSWFERQQRFGETPLVPREELPEAYQPHASFYNKMINMANGIDPTPREEREQRRIGANNDDSEDPEEQSAEDINSRQPAMQVVQAKVKRRAKFDAGGNIVGTYEVKVTDDDNMEDSERNYEESKGIEMTATILQAAQIGDSSDINVGFDVQEQEYDPKDDNILDDSVKVNKGAAADRVNDEDIEIADYSTAQMIEPPPTASGIPGIDEDGELD